MASGSGMVWRDLELVYLNWSILRNRIRSVGLGFLGQVYLCLTLASYWVPLELKGGMERKELDADTYFLDAGLDGRGLPSHYTGSL